MSSLKLAVEMTVKQDFSHDMVDIWTARCVEVTPSVDARN